MRRDRLVGLIAIGLLAAACGDVDLEADKANRGALQRGAAKADLGNSCKDHCGGQAPDGCWCDAACVDNNDCCADKGPQCDGQPGSCVGQCGGMSPAGCWCDDTCDGLGDCCADKAQACTTTPPPPPQSCDQASDCAACLAISDCNWTGGSCAGACLMDTDCYGPGNPAAPSCPATPPPPPPPTVCADITDEQQCKDRPDCERDLGVCLMWCIPDDVGCCDFLGCKDAGSSPPPPPPSCSGAWIDPSDGKCYAANDAALPDDCCDAERKTTCEQINQDYGQAVTSAKSCAPMVTAPQCTFYVDEDLMCPICGTFVNSKTALQASADKWKLYSCAAVGGAKGWWGCPPVVCDPPLSGTCQTSGRCTDVFQ